MLVVLAAGSAKAVDVDCDGRVTAVDALRVLRRAVGEPLSLVCGAACEARRGPWRFTEVSLEAGVAVSHTVHLSDVDTIADQALAISAGVGAGDFDNDGWIDLYVLGGRGSRNFLFRNRGDGTFEELAEASGVALPGSAASGATFADVDGDGWVDLLVGGVAGDGLVLLRNRSDGTFADVTADSGLRSSETNMSQAFGDVDGDGDLDLLVAHWGSAIEGAPERLWRNQGDMRFEAATAAAGIGAPAGSFDWSFTPNFSDLDHDGDLDVLIASDFGTSQAFLNNGAGRFLELPRATFTDENGMGAALADVDGDGHVDWFVTSIYAESVAEPANWGTSGNRLYRNDGTGGFRDATDEAGVQVGRWGWGACAADFDLDGRVDLFHVNGIDFGTELTAEFHEDASLLYIAEDGDFRDRAAELGLEDRGQGRGVVCFDYDRDGDIDIFVSNARGPTRLYRNDGVLRGLPLTVELRGQPPNTRGVGARVELWTSSGPGTDPALQVREIRAGSNFLSQDPAVAHFGLPQDAEPRRLRVHWPGGSVTEVESPVPGRALIIEEH